jgi:hypothetical protein
VYGLSLANGSVRWRAHLGTPARASDLPCGNIDPLGITSTPAYDPVTGSLFVVAETTGAHHTLTALDPATGRVRWQQGLDMTDRDRSAEQQRGALAVANGRVYVPFGGLYGDCGDYLGYVTATPVTGAGATTWYQVPTAREGGIWAASGVATDAAGGVWVAVGNGASTSGDYDDTDSVLRLSADLSQRLDVFAPAGWAHDNAADADLGSTGPLLLDGSRVLVAGKSGSVYLLAAGHLGGIGGQEADLSGCRAFGGMAWDVTRQAAFVPCDSGLIRVDVGTRTLVARWRSSVAGSPIVVGSAVYAVDATAGILSALDADTGRTRALVDVGVTSRFASPSITGSRVLIGTLTGVSAVDVR